MQTITTYIIMYMEGDYMAEQTFRSLEEVRLFISKYNITPIKVYKQQVLGTITEITL